MNGSFIVIGGGIAGMAAAEAIRHTISNADILLITEEDNLCANRPMLIEEFAKDGSGDVLFQPQDKWQNQYKVKILYGVRAEKIKRNEKTVLLSNGQTVSYDKLIYAAGAKAYVPPIPGSKQSHVFTVRTNADMAKIRKAMKDAGNAAVIGGGMLGLENAWGLCREKLHVSIIERAEWLASGQLDRDGGSLMKKRIERFDADVWLMAEVINIGKDFVRIRYTADGGQTEERDLPADIVIISAGISPNTEQAKEAGIKTTGSNDRWIAVDKECRTSDPDIFAAGDVAAVNGRNDAIWDEARSMGHIAGTNAAAMLIAESKAGLSFSGNQEKLESTGSENMSYTPGGIGRDAHVQEEDSRLSMLSYNPVIPEHVFVGFDTEVFTMADSSGSKTKGTFIRHADREIFDYKRERYIRASFEDGILAGILLINAPELVPDLMEVFRQGAGEDKVRKIISDWKLSHHVDLPPVKKFHKR